MNLAIAVQPLRVDLAHTLKTQELWLAAVDAFESKAAVAIESNGTELMVKILGPGSGKHLGKSPLGVAHIARLFAAFATDNPSYIRYVHALMRSQIIDSRRNRFRAWVAVLRFCANDFSYIEDFRRLSVQMRLSVAWAHGDRLFRILANLGIDNEWIRDHFENSSAKALKGLTQASQDNLKRGFYIFRLEARYEGESEI
jgi:hypothetical protein